MAEQDVRRAYKTQPEFVLPLPSGPWAPDRQLQEFMGPLGAVGPGREIKATLAPLQRKDEPSRF